MKYTQAEMEALYSQKQIHTVLHQSIKYELDNFLINWALVMYYDLPKYINGDYYESKNKRIHELCLKIADEGLDWLVVAIAAAVLHTHTTQTIQQCVGYLQAFLPHEDAFDRARTAGELLAIGANAGGLFEIERNGSGNNTLIQVHHWDLIDTKLMNSFDWINDTCFNPPLIEAPLEVKSNFDCGYHEIKEPVILGKLTMHDGKQNLSTLNELNKIEWVLDPDVLAEPEVPSKPLETRDQHAQFLAMAQSSQFIYSLLGQDPFWLVWQYDSRGRIYSHGYHVNLQAAEYKKACLSFNRYEVLT